MPIWNHVWTAGDDLQDLAILQMFEGAFIERNAGRSGVPITPSVAGADIFQYSRWRNMQFDGTFRSNASTELWNGVWVTPWVESRDYAGEADFSLGIVDWNYILANALGGNGYTRKHPKEFANLSSTVYDWTNTAIDPNAFVNGDHARCLANGLIYQRVAGVWVLTTNVVPDAQVSYGRMQAGDYFGPWILNEIRDVVNLLVAFTVVAVRGGISTPYGWSADGTNNGIVNSVTPDSATWAGAQAACQVGPNSFSAESPPSASASGRYVAGIAQYEAGFGRSKAKLVVHEFSDGLTASVDLYTFGIAGSTGFDNNGDPVALGALTKFQTLTTTGAGSTIKSAFVGALTVPNWGAAPPPDVEVGYSLRIDQSPNGSEVVFRYDVAGGYTYQP
jgi:hypothetical protein